MVVGHQFVRAALERNLPPVVMLKGPPSIGKWTLAEHLVGFYGGLLLDQVKIEYLSIDAARELRQVMSRSPLSGQKYAIVRLDRASAGAMQALLKLLEEPPSWARIFLISSGRVLDTITSRAQTFPLGLLPATEMAKVLAEIGIQEPQLSNLVSMSRGQVAPLLEVGSVDKSRHAVLAALKALQEGDPDLLDRTAQTWGAQEHALLRRWCSEAATGRWGVFKAADTDKLLSQDPGAPVRVLLALRTESRAKLSLRVGLGPLVEERRQRRR